MPDDVMLELAPALAARNPICQLGEAEEYRATRQRLLVGCSGSRRERLGIANGPNPTELAGDEQTVSCCHDLTGSRAVPSLPSERQAGERT